MNRNSVPTCGQAFTYAQITLAFIYKSESVTASIGASLLTGGGPHSQGTIFGNAAATRPVAAEAPIGAIPANQCSATPCHHDQRLPKGDRTSRLGTTLRRRCRAGAAHPGTRGTGLRASSNRSAGHEPSPCRQTERGAAPLQDGRCSHCSREELSSRECERHFAPAESQRIAIQATACLASIGCPKLASRAPAVQTKGVRRLGSTDDANQR